MENDVLIKQLREELKILDAKILRLVKQRLDLGRKIGRLKTENQIAFQDKNQESLVKERFNKWAKDHRESEDMTNNLASLLMTWTLDVQKSQKQ